MTDKNIELAQNHIKSAQKTIKVVIGAMSTLGLRTEFLENALENLQIALDALQRQQTKPEQ